MCCDLRRRIGVHVEISRTLDPRAQIASHAAEHEIKRAPSDRAVRVASTLSI
jgi:hypothetical protein